MGSNTTIRLDAQQLSGRRSGSVTTQRRDQDGGPPVLAYVREQIEAMPDIAKCGWPLTSRRKR